MSRTGVLSDWQTELFCLVNYVFLCTAISVFGTVVNVINMVVFYRQGLDTTINISFFSLAVSDLCCQVVQQFFNIFLNPFFQDCDLPLIYKEVQYLSAGVVREAFAKITCFITVYITAERCLCIAFPLHVKQMITPRRTTLMIVLIYLVTLLSASPLYCTSHIGWKFVPGRNRTLLGLVFGAHNDVAEAVVYIAHGLSGFVSFLAVVLLTLTLIHKLRQKISWQRKSVATQDKSETISSRDRRTIFMVVLIAGLLIVCYTPQVLLFVATFVEPEFNFRGRYFNLYYSLWSVAVLFENINSSVNIFLYYRMSSKLDTRLESSSLDVSLENTVERGEVITCWDQAGKSKITKYDGRGNVIEEVVEELRREV